jgi:hypothetical protein
MIPLVTKPCRDCEPLNCDALPGGVDVTDDEEPTYFDTDPAKGVKLYFTAGEGPEDFEVVDRDVCDGRGEIVIPTYDVDGTPYLAVDVYIRVLGQPNKCMRINGYAEDEMQGLWFWSGTVTLKRMPGKSTFEKINELFLVWWCDVCDDDDVAMEYCAEAELGQCILGTEEELSVFDDRLTGYFWDIENNGARNVQVRLYPRTSPYLPE